MQDYKWKKCCHTTEILKEQFTKTVTIISKGIYSAKNDVITIKELPRTGSDKYKEYLESLIIDSKTKSNKQIVRYYNSYCNDVDVHFEIIMDQNLIASLNVYDEKIKMTKWKGPQDYYTD